MKIIKINIPGILLSLCLFISIGIRAQNIGINTTGTTPTSAAILDLNTGNTFTSPNGKGLLIPNVLLASATDVTTVPITSADTSLLVFNKKGAGLTPSGFYYWNGASWTLLATGSPWSLYGNAGTTPGFGAGQNYVGTSDNTKLLFGVNGIMAGDIDPAGPTLLGYQAGNSNTNTQSTAVGYQALFSNTTGGQNTALGYKALYSDATTSQNTAIGDSAMYTNTAGGSSIAIGVKALYSNTTGNSNTACGFETMYSNTTGGSNTAYGYEALFSNTTTGSNTACGYQAGYNNTAGGNTFIGDSAGYRNTTGNGLTYIGYAAGALGTNPINTTAIGYKAFYSNINSDGNVAVGYTAGYSCNGGYDVFVGDSAGYFSTTATQVTFVGYQAGVNNTTGNENTASGYKSLYTNTTGKNNTALGYEAMYTTNGSNNTANGYEALYSASGSNNTATGYSALYQTTSGAGNTANGDSTLFSNTTGINNTAVGDNALYNATTASSNSAVGYRAGYNNTAGLNVFVGDSAGYQNTTGNQNTFIGCQSGVTAGTGAYTNITCIGYKSAIYTGVANNSINLGNTSITNICGQVGSLTTYSDRRIKENIQENVPGLAFIMKLRPVTYHINLDRENNLLGIQDEKNWPGKYDIEKITQSGFIAQEVDSAARSCGYDFNGISKPANPNGLYSLGYTYFVVPLVKAVQEQQQIMDTLTTEHQTLNANYTSLNAKYLTLSAQLQKIQDENIQAEAKDESDITELKKEVNAMAQAQSNGKQ